jgi:hypothetical protein
MAQFIRQVSNWTRPYGGPVSIPSSGATLATSASNAWNFGPDPIRFKLVISLVFYGCSRSTNSINRHSLASRSLSRDPLAEVWVAIRQSNASRFAMSKKSHAILTA